MPSPSVTAPIIQQGSWAVRNSSSSLELLLRWYGCQEAAAGLGIEEERGEGGWYVFVQCEQPFCFEMGAVAVQSARCHVVLRIVQRAGEKRDGLRVNCKPHVAVARHFHGVAEQDRSRSRRCRRGR